MSDENLAKRLRDIRKQDEDDRRRRNPVEALVGDKSGNVFLPRDGWISARAWNGRQGGYSESVSVEIPDLFRDVAFYPDERIEIEGFGPERRFTRKLTPDA